MINLIKMNLYHLKHSVSTYVFFFIAIAFGVFCTVMTNVDIQVIKEEAEKQGSVAAVTAQLDTDDETLLNVGIFFDSEEEWATGKIEIGSMIRCMVNSKIIALFIVIFTAISTAAEQKNGYIKNIGGLFPKREKLVLSKLAVIGLQVFFLMAAFILSVVCTGFVLWGKGFYMGSILKFVQYLAVSYLLHLGIAAVTMFLTILLKGSALSMTIGILEVIGVFTPFYLRLINRPINHIGKGNTFNILKYFLTGNIVVLEVKQEVLLRGLTTSIVFIMAAVVFSVVITKKRDI